MTLQPGTWVRVVRGDPTPEELAALLLALDQLVAADAPPARKAPAWQRAARLEGLGAGPLISAADPRLLRLLRK